MYMRSLTLANGLRCQLIHQPDASAAAALLRVAAGSLDDPDRWPGLAHLLEHLLFCGSQRFSDRLRLMPWVQQQGGQINATTQLSRSAYFFQLPSSVLAAGLTRLADMLAAPLLTPQAIKQECAVIDAEYQLLRNHAETLSEAALLDQLGGAFRRFRVGNQAAFGDNVTELQAALRDFHHYHYRAANMQLWLSGPQSLTELEQLAQNFAAHFPTLPVPAAAVYAPPVSAGNAIIRLAGEESVWLSLLLTGKEDDIRDNVTLLTAFWQDEAPGSLMAQLRAERLCCDLSVQWLWQDAQHSMLVLRFNAPRLGEPQARRIGQLFWHHLDALCAASAEQHQHYLQLAQRDFQALSPLEQLRGRALNFAPPDAVPVAFAGWAATLPQARQHRLLTQQQSAGTAYATQGFTLQRADWHIPPAEVSASVRWHFWPRSLPAVTLNSSRHCAALPLIAAVQSQETLLLRPACYHTLSDADALARQAQLRPLLAQWRHAGGSGSWQQQQGVWQLVLNLPATACAALAMLPAMLSALQSPVADAEPATQAPSIAIRQLLAALPQQLMPPSSQLAWQAAWCGSESVWQYAAHAFTDFPLAPASTPTLQRGITTLACPGTDRALLLFIPLPQLDDRTLAALRALALMFEPHFFQRLRVDQQVGYVVTARYQRIADVDGLLLALQSPSTPWRALLAHCKRFLRDMQDALTSLDEQTLRGWQHTLLAQCLPADNASAASEALRQQQGLPCLTHAAVDALTLPDLQRLHQRIVRERRRWRVLVAQEP